MLDSLQKNMSCSLREMESEKSKIMEFHCDKVPFKEVLNDLLLRSGPMLLCSILLQTSRHCGGWRRWNEASSALSRASSASVR